MSITEEDLAGMIMEDDGFGCAITTTPLTRADLDAYLAVKTRYEGLVAEWGTTMTPGVTQPTPAMRAGEAALDAMKDFAGWGGPHDPLCCQRYSFLHHPAVSVRGCRWNPLYTRPADVFITIRPEITGMRTTTE
jgi:hypothetical protein